MLCPINTGDFSFLLFDVSNHIVLNRLQKMLAETGFVPAESGKRKDVAFIIFLVTLYRFGPNLTAAIESVDEDDRLALALYFGRKIRLRRDLKTDEHQGS
jgi:hypothetical protein